MCPPNPTSQVCARLPSVLGKGVGFPSDALHTKPARPGPHLGQCKLILAVGQAAGACLCSRFVHYTAQAIAETSLVCLLGTLCPKERHLWMRPALQVHWNGWQPLHGMIGTQYRRMDSLFCCTATVQYRRLLALLVRAGCNIAAGLPIDRQVHTCLRTITTPQTSNANFKIDGCAFYIHMPTEGQGTRKGRCTPVCPSNEGESYWNLLCHQHKLHAQ